MDSQTVINKEDSIDKQNTSFSYIAIPINALDLSNQEVQTFLSQNIIVKSLPDNKFCVVETSQNAIRPSVIEYNCNSDPNDLLQNTQITLSTSENNNTLQQKPVQIINPKDVQNKKKKRLQCNICSTKFKNPQYYQNHMEQHHRKKKYKCDQCSSSFNVQDNFMIHKAMHTKGEPACPLCDRKFQRLASLKSHLLLHQIEETFTCSDCQLEFENEDDFNDHVTGHLNDLTSNKSEGTTMKRVCSYCNSNFESYKEYKEHISYHIKVNRLLHNAKKSKRRTNINKELPHKCDICQKSFVKFCLLERHFRIHSGEKPFVCKECNRGFAQKGTLQIHMSKHTGVKPFLCTLCPARFCQKGNLRVHVEKTHTVPGPGENMYKCSLCSCIFKKVASLNGHITRIHSGKKYDDISEVFHQLKELEKQTCGKANNESEKNNLLVASESDLNLNSVQLNDDKSNSKDNADFKYVTLTESIGGETVRNYEVKQRIVGDVRWYACSFCIKEFKKPSDLLRHIRVHTREKPYSCDICKHKFSLKSTLSTHLNTHVKEKIYKCKICDRLLPTAKALYVHIRRHERGELNNEKQKEKHVSICNICKRSGFQNELELKIHIEEHKKDQQNDGGLNDNQNKQPLLLTPQGLLPVDAVNSNSSKLSRSQIKPHTCSVCCASFTRKVHLKRHLLTHTGERKFKCEICPKSFYTTYAMNEHLKFHYNIKNHACKTCGKRFVTRAILKRHSVTHSTQKPYFCPVCSKQFKTISLCRKHMLTHSTERPYACSYCEKAFKTVSLCRDHIKIHKKQNEKDAPDYIRVISCDSTKKGGSHNGKNEMILNAVNLNVDNLNPSSFPTTNTGDIINPSEIVTADVLDNQKTQGDQIPMLLQIEKTQNSDPIQINNNIPLENNPNIQTIFIDYDDFQMRLLPNYNFLTSDFSQVKGGTDEVQNNLEQSNILLSIDPALNQINQENGDAFLTANVATVATNNVVEIQNPDVEHSEQIQSRNFDKIVVTENVSDLTLPHHNVALFGAEDFADYGIHIAQSEIIADKITTTTLKDARIQSSPVITKSAEESSQLNNNDNNSKHNDQEENEATAEDLDVEKEADSRKNDKKTLVYQCSSCYRTFTKKSTFLKHNDYHRKKQDNVCKYCSKIFKKPSDLVRHLRTHTGERPFQCTQCEKSFSLKSTLDSHYKTHKPGGHKEFNCHVCNSYFSSKSSLKVHMLLHTGAKPYSCPSCPLKFRTTGQRQSHMKKHTKEGSKNDKVANKSKSLKRKIATLALATAQQLQEITEASPNNETQVLTNEQTVRNVNAVSELQNDKAVEMDTLFYQLDFEGNTYIHENLGTIPISFIQLDDDNLLRIRLAATDNQLLGVSDFLLTDTSAEPVSNQQSINDQPNVNDFPCPICKKKLKNQKVLKKHMKIHERKKYFCDKCAKTFAFEHELNEHDQIHNGINKFPCKLCANKFDTDANLKIHMKRMHSATSKITSVN